MTEDSSIRAVGTHEYRNFFLQHIDEKFAQPSVAEVWHYTNAQGLIGILESGKIWSTQIACLNDSLEQRYFSDLIHAAIKSKRAQNTNSTLDFMLRAIDDVLSHRDFASSRYFVACFSAAEDDLSQWRGYGGGECGYAIGFRVDGIREAIKTRSGASFRPMNYKAKMHQVLVDEIAQMAEKYFMDKVKQDHSEIQLSSKQGLGTVAGLVEGLAKNFSTEFDVIIDISSSILKHPKFKDEREHRITTLLQDGEEASLEFRQKRTLLARHLPLDLRICVNSVRRLPITRICVGPGPAQQVSCISVRDLLLKFKYQNIPVEPSKVPYRVP